MYVESLFNRAGGKVVVRVECRMRDATRRNETRGWFNVYRPPSVNI